MFLILLALIVNTGGAIFIEYSWRLSTWNPPLVMAIVESLKCVISIILWKKTATKFSTKYILHFAIPGALYSFLNIANNYAFQIFPSYVIYTVTNVKILWSMLMAKYFLKQTFSPAQWKAAGVILLGLVIITTQKDEGDDRIIFACLYGFVSSAISTLAGTYCEYLYNLEPEETIYAQNVKLYVFGAVFNAFVYMIRTPVNTWHWSVNVVVCYYAFSGIIVSFVMKYLGNVVRNILGSVTMVSVMLCSVFLLGNAITLRFVIGAVLVISGCLVYNLNKVEILKKENTTTIAALQNEEKKTDP